MLTLLNTMVNFSKNIYILAEHSLNNLQSKINDKKHTSFSKVTYNDCSRY